jgi:transcriptional regulator
MLSHTNVAAVEPLGERARVPRGTRGIVVMTWMGTQCTLRGMYTPKLFLETDRARLFDLIESLGFGVLIAADDGAVEIAHVPYVLDRERGAHGELRFHVARANRIWKLATQGPQLTVVFNGPHGYVSPQWYERPSEQVPTWNYAVAYAHGRVTGPMGHEELCKLLDDLVTQHERGAPEPWTIGNLVPSHREELLDEIVGMTLSIDRLEGKFKLSQNRSLDDQDRVVRAFEERGRPDDLAMARLMAELSKQT